MATKKSALTAALSGAPVAPIKPMPPKFRLDEVAFPCVAYATRSAGTSGSIETISEGMEALEVVDYIPVGSLPAASLGTGSLLVSIGAAGGSAAGSAPRHPQRATCHNPLSHKLVLHHRRRITLLTHTGAEAARRPSPSAR